MRENNDFKKAEVKLKTAVSEKSSSAEIIEAKPAQDVTGLMTVKNAESGIENSSESALATVAGGSKQQEAGRGLQKKAHKPILSATNLLLLSIYSLAPLFFLVNLSLDPVSRLCFQSDFKSQPGRLKMIDDKFLSQAIKLRPDLENIDKRYRESRYDNWKGEDDDLKTLIDRDCGDGSVFLRQADFKYKEQGLTPEVLSLLEKAAKKASASVEVEPLLLVMKNNREVFRASCQTLITLGHSEIAAPIVKKFKADQFSEFELAYLKAQLLREDGRLDDAFKAIPQIGWDRILASADPHRLETLRAVLDLDENKPGKATELVESFSPRAPNYWDKAVFAFYYYEKKDFAKAIQFCLPEPTPEDNLSEGYLQAFAACKLLEAHIYTQLEQSEKANAAILRYKSLGLTGKYFVPLVFRPWLTDVPLTPE